MKNFTLLFLFSILFFQTYGQDTIDVVQKKIKIGGTATVKEYYGFADGDKIIFSLNVEGKKELKDVTISEYPNSVKFADHKTQEIQNKVLKIEERRCIFFLFYFLFPEV